MNRFEKAWVNLSTLIVGASGAIYGVMKYLMTSDDPFSVISHPLQPWMLDVHVLAGPVLVLAVGWIARDHILAKARKHNGGARRSGWFALVCLLPMISTGYLIQVFTNETARLVSVIVHLVTGTIYMTAFIAHLAVSRRLAARKKGTLAVGGWAVRQWVSRVATSVTFVLRMFT